MKPQREIMMEAMYTITKQVNARGAANTDFAGIILAALREENAECQKLADEAFMACLDDIQPTYDGGSTSVGWDAASVHLERAIAARNEESK